MSKEHVLKPASPNLTMVSAPPTCSELVEQPFSFGGGAGQGVQQTQALAAALRGTQKVEGVDENPL